MNINKELGIKTILIVLVCIILYSLFFIPVNAQIRSLIIQCTGPTISGNTQCTLCDLINLLDNLKNFAVQIMGAIVVGMILWGGFTIILSGGNPSKYAQGKWTIAYALIGLAIILSAYIIVSEFFRLLAPGTSLLPWNQIRC